MNLSDDQLRSFAALLDEVIPPSADGRMPGAGQLGLAERVARDLGAQPALAEMVVAGLASADRVAREECDRPFAALAATDRRRVLARLVEAGTPLPTLLAFPTYVAYYEHPAVLVALGREARPPHPGGYELEPFDERLLDGVRKRAPFYREC